MTLPENDTGVVSALQTKVSFESAKVLTKLILSYSVMSLEDHILIFFSKRPTLSRSFLFSLLSVGRELNTECKNRFVSYSQICNGNRTEWSPTRSVIIQVINKS